MAPADKSQYLWLHVHNGDLRSRWSAALSASSQLLTYVFSPSFSTEGCCVLVGRKTSLLFGCSARRWQPSLSADFKGTQIFQEV